MWILHLLPESLILVCTYLMIGIGAAGLLISWFITFIPWLNIHRTVIQIVSSILLAAGIYWYGGYSVEMIWRNEVAKLEEKVKAAEEKSSVVNKEIEIVYRDRVRIVKQDVVVLQEKIREVEKVIDRGCVVAPEAISILNEAARHKKSASDVNASQKDNKQ